MTLPTNSLGCAECELGPDPMIDLHCHLLPGVDDGAPSLESALAMARLAVGDGIALTACTPRIFPGIYDNAAREIRLAVLRLHAELRERGIELELTYGADVHLMPDILEGLRGGRIPGLNGGRYVLLEPPQFVAPQHMQDVVFLLLANGYVPIIAHPERLGWIREGYEELRVMAEQGAWIQLTAGSLKGRFGREPRYWAEHYLDDGLVHVLATDAHSPEHRPPLLAEGRQAAERWVGREEAARLVVERPRAVVDNLDPGRVRTPQGLLPGARRGHRWTRMLRRLWR